MGREDWRMTQAESKCIRRSNTDTCVIFVHGILSSGKRAWVNSMGDSWPEMLAQDPSLPDCSIYVFSYRSDLFCQNYSLRDVVDSMREFFNLNNIWRNGEVILVCHSMGGIIARKFIVSSQTKLIQRGIKIGLFLIASPSIGSRDANAFHIIERLLRNSQAEALRFSQGNGWLNELDSEFLTLKEGGKLRIVGKELIEDEAIKLKKWLGLNTQTVEPFSAARYFGEPYKVPFSNHINIAKPVDRAAPQYRLLVHFIAGMTRPRSRIGLWRALFAISVLKNMLAHTIRRWWPILVRICVTNDIYNAK
jgi:pimeloyl-ACP methyl ester carboxylesterase